MNSSVLYPPNHGKLGGDGIGKVILRARPLSHERTAFGIHNVDSITEVLIESGVLSRHKSVLSISTATTPDVSKRTSRDTLQVNTTPLSVEHPEKRKKGPTSNTANPSRKRQLASFTDTEKDDVFLCRSRRRADMQQYRNKIRKHTATLKEDVQQLREEIQQLPLKDHTLLVTAKTNTAWGVVAKESLVGIFRMSILSEA
ncbi:hypothetical protein PC129_g3494 [Phytophthora cactorum]|uniref:Uncharacterized protein n=1 Tax=Phytophthora cactorum TaxID=29920 RepID=A0A329SJS8_9STRA|nr:hypothetical protein Pcac1_g21483 [Phytophthora cactorum]KAG2814009.1 hypothetical protein PC112_g14500 [Phytophthora cactorum]KAG2921245.1 hypothetical protein PC114_g5743 [Phytophthora cactorum]KAG2945942.1 hypothetical protein PC117_g8030 [Phytophthora cactorum]KAG3034069.1 hypothetical protein PC119_g5066 [Phytophthora cactorum]